MICKFKILILLGYIFLISSVLAEEEEIYLKAISDQIQVITKDLKTLEKAVYQKSDVVSSKSSSLINSNGLNEDIMTKHLLKLNEIEDQFRELTNKFEEVNFKLDKLSTRVTKIQSDNQLRFSDLESGEINSTKQKQTKLPGSTKPQDFGAAPAYQTTNLPKEQSINSVESAKTVISEEPEKRESLLPDKPAEDQYEFAVSFMKIGDYETAEFALKEFIDKNRDHDLAGSAQYWYGETFRIRQLYSDAATAYLDGYQNYPKSNKAPDNLLKLGITMVQLGEKDQGCKMISGLKKEYPKASKSVLQKAQYEQKNSSVNLKNGFKDFKDLSNIFLNFKKKLDKLKKQNYLVAVSGGPDSLALVALSKAYNYLNKTKFLYVLVDHNIRKNSHLEAKKVKDLLNEKKINLKIFTNKKKITRNIQAEARNIRYEILINYCKKNKIGTLLTAHNLEDQVETFLIRLSRGSGLKGLAAMRPLRKIDRRINLYRPLLDIKKKYLIKISKNIFGKYLKDPSNKDTKYLRAKIRSLKKPLETSGIKYDQIFKSIQNLSSSKATLDQYLKKVFKGLIVKKNKEVLINFKKFEELSNDIKIALLNESIKKLKKNYYDLRSKKIKNLIEDISKQNFKKSTLGGCIFFKNGDYLRIKSEFL